MKHLLKILDLSYDEIIELLNLADQLKYEKKNNIPHELLKGKSVGMIFNKSSTRTRVSFETAIYELGAYPVVMSMNDLQINRGEEIEDTAKILSAYLDGLMVRTYDHEEVEILAKIGSIPIINGLTDFSHPCQALADMMTIREYKSSFKDLKFTFIGDGNNMAHSLIVACLKLGMEVSVASPKGYEIDKKILDFTKIYKGKFVMCTDVFKASVNADVLYTDVWASMGQEEEKIERKKAFNLYQINDEVMNVAKKDAIVLHCLPAHKGEEITKSVFDKHANEIFNQAENRKHVQKAILVKLIK